MTVSKPSRSCPTLIPARSGSRSALFTAAAALSLFAGCALGPETAFKSVQTTVGSRQDIEVSWPRSDEDRNQRDAAVAKLLNSELDADSAVKIALLNSRELQATFEELGISQAELAAAGLFRNPTLFASSRWPDRSPRGADLEFSLTADLLDDFLVPLRRRLAKDQVAVSESRVAQAVLELSARVRMAFYTFQASSEFSSRIKAIADANDAAADLAKRQFDAGNISCLDLANQQAASQQAQLELLRADAQLKADREGVNRLLGLSAPQTSWKASGNLPLPPSQIFEPDVLESNAMNQRLDLAAAKSQVGSSETAYKLRAKTRFSPVSLGIDTERNPDGSRDTGPQIQIGLPIFDQGQADLVRLAAELRRSQDSLESLKAQIGSEVRTANTSVAATKAVADYYTSTLLPLRKVILRETVLNYNAMQKSTYELLMAKESEQMAERERIEAIRDYWIARVRLEQAVGGRLPPPNSTAPGKN